MRIAAMDLGTNTFRILISEYTGDKLKNIYRETNITRLGEGLNKDYLINDSAVNRSTEILKKYKSISEQYGVSKVVATGTSAFRNALNSDKIVSYFREEAGIDIEVITGEKEAALTVKGVLECMNQKLDSFYHMDIGGGSTEISLIVNGKIEFSVSIELGVVSLAEDSDLNTTDIKLISDKVSNVISSSLKHSKNQNTRLPLVATSGTPIVVACILISLKEFNASRVNGMRVDLEQIEEIKKTLIKDNDSNELMKYGDILKGREDLIVPGTIILSETMKILRNDCMIISESGLLEGLSYQYI